MTDNTENYMHMYMKFNKVKTRYSMKLLTFYCRRNFALKLGPNFKRSLHSKDSIRGRTLIS